MSRPQRRSRMSVSSSVVTNSSKGSRSRSNRARWDQQTPNDQNLLGPLLPPFYSAIPAVLQVSSHFVYICKGQKWLLMPMSKGLTVILWNLSVKGWFNVTNSTDHLILSQNILLRNLFNMQANPQFEVRTVKNIVSCVVGLVFINIFSNISCY